MMMKRILLVVALSTFFCVGLTSVFSQAKAATAADIRCPRGWSPLATDSRTCCPPGSSDSARSCLYAKYINPTVKLLSVAAGIAAVIGIVIGGIQYASSGGDPQKAAAGKGKVIKAVYGLVAFMFLFSALQFMSPGGISSNPVPNGNGSTLAQKCSKTFLGIKPWFAYLPDDAFEPGTCNLDNFSIFGSSGNGQRSHLVPVLLAVADGLVRIAAVAAFIFVIAGGIKLTLSQGEPDRAKTARESILNALIGLVIALIAAAVVSFIGTRLTS